MDRGHHQAAARPLPHTGWREGEPLADDLHQTIVGRRAIDKHKMHGVDEQRRLAEHHQVFSDRRRNAGRGKNPVVISDDRSDPDEEEIRTGLPEIMGGV